MHMYRNTRLHSFHCAAWNNRNAATQYIIVASLQPTCPRQVCTAINLDLAKTRRHLFRSTTYSAPVGYVKQRTARPLATLTNVQRAHSVATLCWIIAATWILSASVSILVSLTHLIPELWYCDWRNTSRGGKKCALLRWGGITANKPGCDVLRSTKQAWLRCVAQHQHHIRGLYTRCMYFRSTHFDRCAKTADATFSRRSCGLWLTLERV